MNFNTELLTELARNANDSNAASKAAAIINGTLNPKTVPATWDWVRQCLHEPRALELKMHALNELLDCHGVEAVRIEDAYVDAYHGDIVATYLNTGDTYCQTIVLDSESGEFLLTSWGDYVEAYEAEQAADAN